MTLFGITGGIGTGKSTSASILETHGIPVVDTDEIARDIVRPGRPALQEVAEYFGQDLIDTKGHLRRSLLAERVFPFPDKLRKLEAILHPRIRQIWMQQVEPWRRENRPLAAVVIPLLFETAAQANFDLIICTACSSATQMQRLRTRGWSDEQMQQRLAAQWHIERKVAGSHRVIWTEGDLSIHRRQLQRVLSE